MVRQLDEIEMEQQSHELLDEPRRDDHQRPRRGRAPCPAASASRWRSPARCSASPKMVMLDEPTAALGVRQTAMVLALIKRLRERGLGVIVISHNLADVFEVADRIYVLRLGREAGDFEVNATSREQVVGAITGAEFGGRTGRRVRRCEVSAQATAPAGGPPTPRRAELRTGFLKRFVTGRPRRGAGSPRPGRDLDHLPGPGEPLPHGDQPHQPGPPDHRGRPDLGGHRARAAARRDRPVGRRGERPVRGDHGRAQRQARLVALPGDRGRRSPRGRRSGCSRAACSPASASRRSS